MVSTHPSGVRLPLYAPESYVYSSVFPPGAALQWSHTPNFKRNESIYLRYLAGETMRQLAEETGISDSRVWQIVQKFKRRYPRLLFYREVATRKTRERAALEAVLADPDYIPDMYDTLG